MITLYKEEDVNRIIYRIDIWFFLFYMDKMSIGREKLLMNSINRYREWLASKKCILSEASFKSTTKFWSS
jgi:hypothetical protein